MSLGIERRIILILQDLKESLSEDELEEVANLVTEHAEYGVALESLCAILQERRTVIEKQVFSKIIDAFIILGFDEHNLDYYREHLAVLD